MEKIYGFANEKNRKRLPQVQITYIEISKIVRRSLYSGDYAQERTGKGIERICKTYQDTIISTLAQNYSGTLAKLEDLAVIIIKASN